MFPILVLLFIAVPIIEIMLFIQVGGLLGMWSTIGIVLFTAVFGAHLVRSQGLQTLTTMQQRLQQGEMPALQIVEGVLLAVAGMLLLTPGFMTDIVGMLILFPPTRAWLAQRLLNKVQVNVVSGGFQQQDTARDNTQGNVYEGQFEHTEQTQQTKQIKLDKPE